MVGTDGPANQSINQPLRRESPTGSYRHPAVRRENRPVVKLRVRAGESIQEAVRRFRKLCERSGLRKEMRRKAYYEKPSERRRREELKRLRKARQHQTSRV
jgi:small subunit ribosomal protein S21